MRGEGLVGEKVRAREVWKVGNIFTPRNRNVFTLGGNRVMLGSSRNCRVDQKTKHTWEVGNG